MTGARPEPAPGLDVHEVDDGLVVYDTATDRVHYLNATATLVFGLCTGSHDDEQIVELVSRVSTEAPGSAEADVHACLAQLRTEGIIR